LALQQTLFGCKASPWLQGISIPFNLQLAFRSKIVSFGSKAGYKMNSREKITRQYIAMSIVVFCVGFIIIFSAIFHLGSIYTSLIARFLIIFISATVASFALALGLGHFDASVATALIMLRRRARMDSLSNPLLIRLSAEAPGTYYHSLNVSNIAQRAAKEIRADSLTVRTAAYYHDIGKLTTPDDYIENIYRSKPNLNMTAKELRHKVKLIIDHVAEGVKIAEENNLSPEMIDFIKEHHGKSRVLNLYNEARSRKLKINVKDFSYPGPSPHSKESAILMLADCVEAAARAKSPLTKRSIREIVENAAADKESAGELKHAKFTSQEISKIKNSMSKSILAVFHHRVAYDQD
jgi:putative nucleotidyltransferase with HDIG domain